MSSTILQNEIKNFTKDSAYWWDDSGPFKPLHKLNPTRIRHIKEQICAHFNLDTNNAQPLKKLNILDIGCGGGLVCEPMTRLGANMTGADADAQAIEVAKAHASDMGLKIKYENKAAEDLNRKFDVILALEVAEHVSDLALFVEECARLVKPGGLIVFSTINRTPKSFMLGIVAAEYILRWVPKGTHNWKQFIKPAELARHVRRNGLELYDIRGLVYNPVNDSFKMSARDLDVNYFLSAKA